MTTRNLVCGLVVLLGAATVRADETTAFVGVHLVPMDREVVLEDQTVLVRGDRIVEVGPASDVRIPDGAQRIDAAGRYLMPGIADMHVHVWSEDLFWLFLANGVTTLRNMWGAPVHQAWQAEIEAGTRIAPTLYTVGPLMDGPGAYWPGSTILETPEQAREAVAQVKAAGFPALKVYNRLSAEVYAAIVETARELDMRIEGHVPDAVGLEGVMQAGQVANEHLTGFSTLTRADDSPYDSAWDDLPWPDRSRKVGELALRIQSGELSMDDVHDPEKIARLAAAVADSGLWNIPTLVVFTGRPEADTLRTLAAPEMRYVDPSTKQRWHPSANRFTNSLPDELIRANFVWHDYRRSVVRALHEAGAGLLLGSDTPNPLVVPGFSIHQELVNLVASGLSPYAALRAGTADAARFLGQSGEWGSVAAGTRADLLLVAQNPLDDVGHVSQPLGVMVRGRWLTAEFLQAQLEGLASQYDGQEAFFAAVLSGDVDGAWALRMEFAGNHDGAELIGEDGVNGAGYMLLTQGNTQAAIELFSRNAEAYPDSGNTWDSLAEAYMLDGQSAKAIETYEKSLAVDPGNSNAEAKLRELRGD